MGNAIRKLSRRNVKKHTCRKCKSKMTFKVGYGIWVCENCGWERTINSEVIE